MTTPSPFAAQKSAPGDAQLRIPTLHQMRSVTKAQLQETIGCGMSTARAALHLKVSVWTVWRACKDYDLSPPPRHCRVKGKIEWQCLYEQHGRNITAMSRAMEMNRTYITRELERYGIYYGNQETRDKAGRWQSRPIEGDWISGPQDDKELVA